LIETTPITKEPELESKSEPKLDTLPAPVADDSSNFLIPKSPISSITLADLQTTSSTATTTSTIGVSLSAPTSSSSTSNVSATVRKSLRANKRLRSFTDEIVFDSPLPLTYHINMDATTNANVVNTTNNQSSSVAATTANTTISNVSSHLATTITSSESKRKQSVNVEIPSKKDDEVKNAKSNKSLAESDSSRTPRKKQKKVDEIVKNVTVAKSANKKSTKKAGVAVTAVESKTTPASKVSKREQKMLKKLEKKNKKKLLLEKMLESSRQQLKQNQEMIEEEIKRHEKKKSKKKLKKLLRQQQQQQMQQPANNLNMFFPPSFQSQLMNPNFFPNLNLNPEATLSSTRPFSQTSQAQNISIALSPMVSSIAQTSSNTSSSPAEPIRCNYKDCNKIFRKQHLLDYHLKYHHYVSSTNNNNNAAQLDLTLPLLQQQSQYLSSQQDARPPLTPQTPLSATNKRAVKRTSRLSTSSSHTTVNKDSISLIDEDNQIENTLASRELDADLEEEQENGIDPYEVIHCKCGNHTSEGFMIQCEICMCWQHGDCANLKSAENVPKHYLCWICKDPGNKLRKLKYQSWMNVKQEKASSLSKNDPDFIKLRLLNECSRKYYNLNLLMYTLEYQMALFDNLTKNKVALETRTASDDDDDVDGSLNQIKKLGLNVSHLQGCLDKRFTEFNAKITGTNCTTFFIKLYFNTFNPRKSGHG
jgi:hypothetical protein